MGSRASIQGDLYSFGILLLEMFTGKRPTDEIFEDGLNIHRYAKMAIPERLMTIVDPSLLQREVNVTITRENPTQMRANMEQCLHSVFEIGLACSVEPSKERMNSEEVIRQLLLVKNAFLPATTNRPSTMQY